MARLASNMNLYWKSAENFDVKRLPRNVNTIFPPPHFNIIQSFLKYQQENLKKGKRVPVHAKKQLRSFFLTTTPVRGEGSK